MRLITVREITRRECSWLHSDISAGSEVFAFGKNTYGCISPAGVAVSLVEDEYPFFELPRNGVEAAQ